MNDESPAEASGRVPVGNSASGADGVAEILADGLPSHQEDTSKLDLEPLSQHFMVWYNSEMNHSRSCPLSVPENVSMSTVLGSHMTFLKMVKALESACTCGERRTCFPFFGIKI